MTQPTAAAHQTAQDLLDFIDASPSPWHAVATCETRLRAAGYEALNETGRWSLTTGGRYYVTRGGSSIIAFTVGDARPYFLRIDRCAPPRAKHLRQECSGDDPAA